MGLTMMVMTLNDVICELNAGHLPEEEREFLQQRQSYLQEAIDKKSTEKAEFLQRCLRLVKGGHTFLGVYGWPALTYEASRYLYGTMKMTEEDARRTLSSFYDQHPADYEEDHAYITQKYEQVVVL